MWIGRWPVEERIVLLNDIPHNITHHSGLLREALKNIYHIQSLHMYTMPMPYEFIYYEAESQCKLSPHIRPHGSMTCPLCQSTPYAAIAT
jgi:hypothetical protein